MSIRDCLSKASFAWNFFSLILLFRSLHIDHNVAAMVGHTRLQAGEPFEILTLAAMVSNVLLGETSTSLPTALNLLPLQF